MSSRRRPPNRRAIETLTFDFQGFTYHISFSRFANGNIREIFVNAGKVGTSMQAMARDLGIAVTIMLQHGILLSDIEGTLTQLDDGSPAGPLGEIIRQMEEVW